MHLHVKEFQSTLPRGERRQPTHVSLTPFNFNSRSREGSDTIMRFSSHHAKFQSTLPRGERLFDRYLIAFVVFISIHAPARGATSCDITCNSSICNFNPRSREGSDRHLREMANRITISIHAPARGATICESGQYLLMIISIHAPARGATRGRNVWIKKIERFQSTLPRGERRCPRSQPHYATLNFNPRSREGSDWRQATCKAIQKHFNPRSREGSDHIIL